MSRVVQVYDRVIDPARFEGGAAEVIWRQCLEAAKDFEVRLITGNVAPAVEAEYATGIFYMDSVLMIRLKGYIPSGPPPLNRRVLVPDLTRVLDEALKEAPDCVVHAHFMITPMVVQSLLIAKKHDAPCIFQPHYHPPHIYPEEERTLRLAYMRHLFPTELEMADAVVAVNSMELEILHRMHGVPREKLHHIPNGVDLEELERRLNEKEVLSKYGLKPEAPIVVQVGRLSKRKNPLDAARAFARVAKRLPQAVLVYVGRPGNQYEEVRDFLRREGLLDRVLFTGFVPNEERNAWLALADVVLALSRWEAFGISVAQALALETPVICTKAGGMVDFVRHGENGFLVDVGDVETASMHLETLLNDLEEAKAMGKRGRELILSQFTWRHMGERLRKLYRRLLK